MCDTCHAGCCRGYNLLITGFDALRMSRDLSLPVGEFCTLLAFKYDVSKRFESNYVPIKLSEPGCEEKRFFLALKRIESPLVPGTVKCYFLNEWKRQHPAPNREDHTGKTIVARCSIYGSRPMMCRTYPTSLHQNVALGFISTPRPIEMAENNAMYQLCPEKWTADQFSTDATGVLHNLAIHRYEQDFYNQAIVEFNKKPHRLADFFPYLTRIYENRFRTAPGANAEKAAQPPPAVETAPPPPTEAATSAPA